MGYNIIHRFTVLNIINAQPLTPELNMVVSAHFEYQNQHIYSHSINILTMFDRDQPLIITKGVNVQIGHRDL